MTTGDHTEHDPVRDRPVFRVVQRGILDHKVKTLHISLLGPDLCFAWSTGEIIDHKIKTLHMILLGTDLCCAWCTSGERGGGDSCDH